MGEQGITKDLSGEDVLGWKDSSTSDASEKGAAGEKADEEGEVHVDAPESERPAHSARAADWGGGRK